MRCSGMLLCGKQSAPDRFRGDLGASHRTCIEFSRYGRYD